jgi:hypothetical protein
MPDQPPHKPTAPDGDRDRAEYLRALRQVHERAKAAAGSKSMYAADDLIETYRRLRPQARDAHVRAGGSGHEFDRSVPQWTEDPAIAARRLGLRPGAGGPRELVERSGRARHFLGQLEAWARANILAAESAVEPERRKARSAESSSPGPARGRERASWYKRHRTDINIALVALGIVIAVVAGIVLPLTVLNGGNSASSPGSALTGQVYAQLEPGPNGDASQTVHGQPVTYIDLYNTTPNPVYKAIVTLVYIQGSGWHSGQELTHWPAVDRRQDLIRQFQRDVQEIPTGRSRVQVSGEWGTLGARPGVEIAYQDSKGHSWLRLSNGKLNSIKQDPATYYGLIAPLDWIEPRPLP